MEYFLESGVYARLSKILRHIPENMPSCFNSIRLEDDLAIVTNNKIMIVEKLKHLNPKEPIHIIIDSKIVEQAKITKSYEGVFKVTATEALKYATLEDNFGYVHDNNSALWKDGSPWKFDFWRDQIPWGQNEEPYGSMFWYGEDMVNLAEASPSGCLLFQKNIDIRKPVLVRDVFNPDWFAIFMPSCEDENSLKLAHIPTWLRTK